MTNEQIASELNRLAHLDANDWIPTLRGMYSKTLYDKAQVGCRLAYPTALAVVMQADTLAALKAARTTIESMRAENRLHGHITDSSADYLHHVKPLIDVTIQHAEEEQS